MAEDRWLGRVIAVGTWRHGQGEASAGDLVTDQAGEHRVGAEHVDVVRGLERIGGVQHRCCERGRRGLYGRQVVAAGRRDAGVTCEQGHRWREERLVDERRQNMPLKVLKDWPRAR